MLRIGEFSRIGRVTIETLRHYDACDLFKPANVDPSTGFRYYALSQLEALNQIVALKEVGFSLDEIARILRDNLTEEQLRGMLKAQLAVTETTIANAQIRREKIQARLKYLTMENDMPVHEVTLRSIDAFTIAAVRETIPTVAQIPERWGNLFTDIARWLSANNVSFGSALTIYHNEGHVTENIDTECAFILNGTLPDGLATPEKPIEIREMSAYAQVATTVVSDWQVNGLSSAYHALWQWLDNHSYRPIDAPRELYFGSPESGENTVEIQLPVEREL